METQLEPLMMLLHTGGAFSGKQQSAWALAYLAAGSDKLTEAVLAALAPLVEQLRTGHETEKIDAAEALAPQAVSLENPGCWLRLLLA